MTTNQKAYKSIWEALCEDDAEAAQMTALSEAFSKTIAYHLKSGLKLSEEDSSAITQQRISEISMEKIFKIFRDNELPIEELVQICKANNQPVPT